MVWHGIVKQINHSWTRFFYYLIALFSGERILLWFHWMAAKYLSVLVGELLFPFAIRFFSTFHLDNHRIPIQQPHHIYIICYFYNVFQFFVFVFRFIFTICVEVTICAWLEKAWNMIVLGWMVFCTLKKYFDCIILETIMVLYE